VTSMLRMEEQIGRCRIVLSLAAMLSVYIDPQTPLLARSVSFVSGRFMIDGRLLAVMGAHLFYSIALYARSQQGMSEPVRVATPWVDMLFAVVIAVMTEGVTSPAYPFLAFAVVTAGLLNGPRQATYITTLSLVLYIALLLVSTHEDADVYVLRPIYLGITGYLLVYLGQQRVDVEERMRALEVADQRHRIARDLHDGYAQALAGINLRLETAREQLGAGAADQVLADLTQLQRSIQREYDDLREYVRSLAGVESTPGRVSPPTTIQLAMRVDFAGPAEVMTTALSIAREGLSNILRHAHARVAEIDILADERAVRMSIRDDGVGFPGETPPWSIDSRVREAGGSVAFGPTPKGTHLEITLPRA